MGSGGIAIYAKEWVNKAWMTAEAVLLRSILIEEVKPWLGSLFEDKTGFAEFPARGVVFVMIAVG